MFHAWQVLSYSDVAWVQMRAASGYVHQDDVLPGTSTVWEYLSFHAALRLPAGHPPSLAAARVRALLRQLSLDKVSTVRLRSDPSRTLAIHLLNLLWVSRQGRHPRLLLRLHRHSYSDTTDGGKGHSCRTTVRRVLESNLLIVVFLLAVGRFKPVKVELPGLQLLNDKSPQQYSAWVWRHS